jgi:hypothetical protein
MELQTAFYIIGIVFMSLMILMFIALLAAVLVIKSKIDKLHRMVDDKVNQAKSIADKVTSIFDVLHRVMRH